MDRLAIEGGIPVRDTLLPYGHQTIDEEDIKAVTEVLRTDWITQGPKVVEFEEKLAAYCGTRYGVAFCNGTAALHAACAAAGISRGDEVITTPLTFAASANAVVWCGGKPEFADIQEDTLNIDPAEIRRKLSQNVKAVIPMDFAGHPVDMESIKTIADEHGLIIIDDACHALGAEYQGKKIGSLADMTVLSFHPVKHITTGEGGMILTDNPDFYEILRNFRHHNTIKNRPDEAWYYEITEPGYNYRITDFQCALGISQLKKLDRFVERRRKIAGKYDEAFAGMDELIIPVERGDVKAAYHIYVVQLCIEQLKVGRKEVFDALRAENIGVNVHYIPLHLHPFYREKYSLKKGDYPKAESYYDRAITLPIFPLMSDEDVNDVIEAVKKVIDFYGND
ncbi:UDP-4-amino-4,6-dideoxy-N-acetyl-beta-L-altrosamine transaminase [Chloroflexota bacterium]